jgi:hypothetical protein
MAERRLAPVTASRRAGWYQQPASVRTTLRTGYVRVLVFCNSCRHQADADLQAHVDAGHGNVLLAVRHRPDRLRGDLAGQSAAVVTAADASPQRVPWLATHPGRPTPAAEPRADAATRGRHRSPWRVPEQLSPRLKVPPRRRRTNLTAI